MITVLGVPGMIGAWCNGQWEDVDYETQLPNWEEGIVQILGFVEAPDGVLHAIVHPCDYNLTEVKGAIGILWPLEFHPTTKQPLLDIVNVDSLERHTLMVPFSNEGEHFLEVWDHDRWADQFLNFE